MKNEPVAWMVDGVLFTSLGAALNISFDIEQPCIPLYTHPANKKVEKNTDLYEKVCNCTKKLDLTDEEIADIISSGEYWTLDEHLNIVSVHFDKFARAILRKAQEK